MPFGVELPEHLGGEPKEAETSAPDGAFSNSDVTDKSLDKVSESAQSETTGKSVDLTDLDKLERFRFAGKEWTPKDLRNSQLMREDYTKKTQELAEARKYADNFQYDLDAVLRDPSKLTALRSVYPKEYVDLAEQILKKVPGSQQTSVEPKPINPNDERLSKIENLLGAWQAEQERAAVKQVDAWLDSVYDRLGKKYSDADSEVVSARAEIAAQRGTKITEAVLEKLYKQHDGEVRARFEKKYKSKVDEQLTAGSKGKDIGPGGAIPGQAPKGVKTIREARNLMLDDIENSKRSL